ncbi:tail fiber assembly protein [Rahnella victoriana]|uniref:tail fiber assembly protein n=1 Tax=Rahnella victoriana TaxID=1510570 RepID=UPI001E2F7EB1|nr:tail fiber assembly protein [Rahnella victoriana]UHM90791.1 tail fiber assembly protein [Rahnella victoriana]
MFYSATTNGFYDPDIKALYDEVKSWPEDAINITDATYQSLLAGQSVGKSISSDADGRPVLIDPPALTLMELRASAERQQSTLMNAAGEAMAPLQDAVDIGEATDAETALLNAWKKYRIALNRLDLSAAPDIDWPEIPA